MKHISKLLMASAMLAGMTVPATAQLTLSLTTTPQTVNAGGIATYYIDISGLKSSPDLNGPALGAFAITLDYNSTIATAQSVTFGSLLSNSGPDYQTSDLSTAGQIYLSEISYDSPGLLESSQSSSFVLGSFTIQGAGAGTTALTFDLNNTSLSDENGNSLTLSAANSGALIVTVPEPGTCALVILGLGALGLQARRRARSN